MSNHVTSRANGGDAYIGDRVRMRRKQLGISQARLAEHMGITFQQVQKYEKGTNRMAVSRLADCAAALEAPLTWFLPPEWIDRPMPAEPDPRIADCAAVSQRVKLLLEEARNTLRQLPG